MSEKQTASRSDEVRERRTRQQTKRQKDASERAYRPLPPVTTRDRTGYTVPRQGKRGKQRRFNAAVALPQDRGHAPSLPDFYSKPRMISLLLVTLLGAALYFLWTSPLFRVTEPQVVGLTRLTAAEVNSAAALQGQLIFLVRPQQAGTNLRRNLPELASAEVMIGLPNAVLIQVTERQPVLLWQQGDAYTWIDEAGIAFRPHGEVTGLPIVAAQSAPPTDPNAKDDPLSPPPFMAPDLVKTALTLAPTVPPGSALTYDAKYGFGWIDARGWQVYFGTTSKDSALKLRVYQSLVDSLTARGIQPAFISVVHADAPYYRMEP
jgi:hypothetical protein